MSKNIKKGLFGQERCKQDFFGSQYPYFNDVGTDA